MKNGIITEFKKYDWTVEFTINKISDKFYEIKFPNCFIEYYYNNMYQSIECSIVFNGKKYDLETALRFNNKKTEYLYHNHSEIEISKYIEQYTKTLNSELLNFILNDFSWCDRANKSLGL